MAEYIDKQAALDVIDDLFQATARGEITNARYVATLADGRIEDIPAADVRENIKGEWIGYPECLKFPNAYADDHIVCSECEECFSILDNDCERFDFCPHCGAYMKGNKDDKQRMAEQSDG